ncbi:MAG: tRNA pseudouridine(55) synthase TruB [Candidatus Magasanikbacteria bacterium]|nr:tRNA pseudouridine(55) synthase TruB [Candidatus Magasanikbacteria bacterium]
MIEDEKEKFILIDKPVGWTSFDVVNVVRKQARAEQGIKNIRVGHAGTLDPFATGLLIIGIGRDATKRLDEFKNLPKTYRATVQLGAVSDTDDPTGVITSSIYNEDNRKISKEKIEKILKKFIGEQTQIPPMYSAKKIDGQRLYKLARAGKTVERQPQKIIIYNTRLIDYAWPELKIEVECSAGTYIRTLARDIGDALGVGGYCSELRRTKIGEYKVENASPAAVFDKSTKI